MGAVAARVERHLDVYGLQISIGGNAREIVDDVLFDFAWFEGRAGLEADLTVSIERRPPDYDLFGNLAASFVTTRNAVYHSGDRTVVDYFGRALSVHERSRGRFLVQGTDEHLVHEAVYQFLVTCIGEHLEAKGLIRLHALGLTGPGGAVALMLPSGGGKSTLALRSLREPGVSLLSDDSPLLDRRGRLYPFPLRIGINPTDAELLPPEHVRVLQRMEHHPKLLLDLPAYVDSIEPRGRPLRHLVIGRRSLGREARLEPLARRHAVAPLLREGVVGAGVFQGIEFILSRGARDAFAKVDVALMRSAACAVAVAKAKLWRLTLSRDHEQNWQALLPLLR